MRCHGYHRRCGIGLGSLLPGQHQWLTPVKHYETESKCGVMVINPDFLTICEND